MQIVFKDLQTLQDTPAGITANVESVEEYRCDGFMYKVYKAEENNVYLIEKSADGVDTVDRFVGFIPSQVNIGDRNDLPFLFADDGKYVPDVDYGQVKYHGVHSVECEAHSDWGRVYPGIVTEYKCPTGTENPNLFVFETIGNKSVIVLLLAYLVNNGDVELW